ncbi:hypothetical protein DL897_17715 [Thermoflavimicrobium daqui]|jgi:hypothetical protein|uniref:Uncharacterized protein n=2 Tax=Thermoflavimicrobium daqui TaxID=2137476 RepID=A0A364K0S9_9BACL|nr:hypothetical protein DL897_17715 [Thermoflavimicrobium daqui]
MERKLVLIGKARHKFGGWIEAKVFQTYEIDVYEFEVFINEKHYCLGKSPNGESGAKTHCQNWSRSESIGRWVWKEK